MYDASILKTDRVDPDLSVNCIYEEGYCYFKCGKYMKASIAINYTLGNFHYVIMQCYFVRNCNRPIWSFDSTEIHSSNFPFMFS